MFEFIENLLADAEPPRLLPCVVLTVTPMSVLLQGSTVTGTKLAGLTYSTGQALALWAPPSKPVILPIGA